VNILAVDTTSEAGGVAIRSGGRTVAEISHRASDGFAHVVFSLIQKALDSAGLVLEQVDIFAAANGPGSFTGVRVGLSTIKGLAEAMGKRAVGVSNLRALASMGTAPMRATVLDARRNQAYVAVYDDRLEVVVPDAVVDFPECFANLPVNGYEIIGLVGSTFEPARNLAGAVAAVAELGPWSDPATLDANYVRRSDAELFWTDDR
jgi:tRNA threonylcarbamoyladenosine biosynthesis protein TsaB